MRESDTRLRRVYMPFYLSHPDDRQIILANGISASDDGYIDIFTDNMVANTIAKDQLFLERYSLFWITPAGITAETEPNDVSSLTTKFQFRIKQSRIDERFVRLMGEHDVIKDRPTTWDYLFWGRRGYKKSDVEEQFHVLLQLESGNITTEQANALFGELSARIASPTVRLGKRKSGPSTTNMLAALKSASVRLEQVWSAVRNLREFSRNASAVFKLKRKQGHNPFHDLSK